MSDASPGASSSEKARRFLVWTSRRICVILGIYLFWNACWVYYLAGWRYGTSPYMLFKLGLYEAPPEWKLFSRTRESETEGELRKAAQRPEVIKKGAYTPEDIPILLAVLGEHPIPEVRAQSADVLGQMGPAAGSAISALRRAGDRDDQVVVRMKAHHAIAVIEGRSWTDRQWWTFGCFIPLAGLIALSVLAGVVSALNSWLAHRRRRTRLAFERPRPPGPAP